MSTPSTSETSKDTLIPIEAGEPQNFNHVKTTFQISTTEKEPEAFLHGSKQEERKNKSYIDSTSSYHILHDDIKPSKGSHAKFLYQNPRYLNEPICQMLPNENSRSVGACLNWSQGKDKIIHTHTM